MLQVVLVDTSLMAKDGEHFIYQSLEFLLLENSLFNSSATTTTLLPGRLVVLLVRYLAPCLFWIGILCQMIIQQRFSPVLCGLHFHQINYSLCYREAFSFPMVLLADCWLYLLRNGSLIQSPSLRLYLVVFSLLSPCSFGAPSPTLRSHIHLELVPVQRKTHGSPFILLHVDPQHRLLMRLFLHCMALVPLSSPRVAGDAWGYQWVLQSVPRMNVSGFCASTMLFFVCYYGSTV